MPVYRMQQAVIQTEFQELTEEQKRKLAEEIRASECPDKVGMNRLGEYLTDRGIQSVEAMDCSLRIEYEQYLKKAEYSNGSIRKYLVTFDWVKRYDIDRQSKTLAGKQKYQWVYRNELLYLRYHPEKTIADLFSKTRQKEILFWDFTVACSRKLKEQIFETMNAVIEKTSGEIVRKNRLLALKRFYQFCVKKQISDVGLLELEDIQQFAEFLDAISGNGKQQAILGICRETAFAMEEKIPWHANVWYLERFHIHNDRMNESNPVKTISFLEVRELENRGLLQNYMKYELGITGQAISTVVRRYAEVRKFVEFLEANGVKVVDCTAEHLRKYAVRLAEKGIEAKGYNERLSGIGHFYQFLVVRSYIKRMPFRLDLHFQKVLPTHHDRSVEKDAYMEIMKKLHLFPEHLRCMFLHLWCIGLRASEVCTLKGDAYFAQGDDRWIQVYQVKMKNYKRIPIPEALYQIMQVYISKHQIQPTDYLFQNEKGGAFLYQTFRQQMKKACTENQIEDGNYIFQSHDYRHTVATAFYDNQVSLQSIRDYLGHAHEEMTRQYVDYVPEIIKKANESYFEQQSRSLAGWLKEEDNHGRE